MTASTPPATDRIFISYRREETGFPAVWLYDSLVEHFGKDQVFRDVDSIALGDDFVEVITAQVANCNVLLALIGDKWLTVTNKNGRRRLDDPRDFVRLEIEAALTRNIRVIPILVAGAQMPRDEDLPTSLAKLAQRQALELSPSRFDFNRLLSVLSAPARQNIGTHRMGVSTLALAQEIQPVGRTWQELHACRQRKIQILEDAIRNSTNADLVQYELAGLYDLDGRTLESLRLHLGNRTHHPRFLRGRYRLAMSLSMLTTDTAFRCQWLAANQESAATNGHLAQVKEDIIRDLEWSGMLSKIGQPNPATLLTANPDPATQAHIKLALLALARNEFRAYRRRLRAPSLLWLAFWYRAERGALLQVLRTKPHWLRHPRRRLLAAAVALAIVEQRIQRLRDPDAADEHFRSAQRKVCRRLGVPGLSEGRRIRHRWRPSGRASDYGKVPWQALYNGACLCALPTSDGTARPVAVQAAITLLRLAIKDPSCELAHPSEWIGVDPDLETLHQWPGFRCFVQELASRDFAAPLPGHRFAAQEAPASGEPEDVCSWFTRLLPTPW